MAKFYIYMKYNLTLCSSCLCPCARVDEACPCPHASLQTGRAGGASEQQLQVKIQSIEEKMGEVGEEEQAAEDSPSPQRRYSLSQAVRDERREMRFNRSVVV